jgi:hypothetical protein
MKFGFRRKRAPSVRHRRRGVCHRASARPMLALDPLADHRAAEVLPPPGDGSKRGAGLTGPVGQPGSARLVIFISGVLDGVTRILTCKVIHRWPRDL